MKSKRLFLIGAILLVFFLLLTLLVCTVDVQPVGPQGSSVGFAGINHAVSVSLGYNPGLYEVSELLGVAALGLVGVFGLIGLVQWIRRKKMLQVDYQILLLGVFYCIVGAIYLFFKFVTINYRPVILQGELEASYPSSHTILSFCVLATAMMEWKRWFRNHRAILWIAEIASVLMLAAIALTRIISGVHWLTDIIGGILISAALITLYAATVAYVTEEKDATV